MLLSLGTCMCNINHTQYTVQSSRLNEDIDFSAFDGNVAPVCLAQKDDGDFEDVDVTSTGWGTLYSGGPQATVLMEVELKTITNTQCQNDYLYYKSDIK